MSRTIVLWNKEIIFSFALKTLEILMRWILNMMPPYQGMKTNLHGRPSSTYRGVKAGVAKGKVNLTKKDLLS